MNNNNIIRPIVDINNPTNAFAYADDINACAKANQESVNQIFKEYSLLTRLCGLKLNAEKTELLHCKQTITKSRIFEPKKSGLRNIDKILPKKPPELRGTETAPNQNLVLQYIINYMDCQYNLVPKEVIKICGIVFSNDEELSYTENVLKKIQKLLEQLNKWRARGLCFLGKSLILKTFGISQIIYVAQCCIIREAEVKQINNIILNFLWTKGGMMKRVERIKRNIIYKPTSLGGFGIIEFGCLNNGQLILLI
jgi:hypothetical protein